jgi:hypothetical protein
MFQESAYSGNDCAHGMKVMLQSVFIRSFSSRTSALAVLIVYVFAFAIFGSSIH